MVARGEAQRIEEEAFAYKQQVIDEAKGDANSIGLVDATKVARSRRCNSTPRARNELSVVAT